MRWLFCNVWNIVPVQRNAGIDAILKQDFAGGPVPILVQRPGETLLEAARKLSKAAASKGAKLMFLIALARGGCFDFADELPAGVVVIESPALGIREHLDKLRTPDVLVDKASHLTPVGLEPPSILCNT